MNCWKISGGCENIYSGAKSFWGKQPRENLELRKHGKQTAEAINYYYPGEIKLKPRSFPTTSELNSENLG